MVKRRKAYYPDVRFYLLLLLFAVIGTLKSYSQIQESTSLGRIALPDVESVISLYEFDPEQNLYIFSASIGDYPLGTPMVLTPKEFEKRVLKEQMNAYFQDKLSAIAQNKGKADEAQKDLLPELYVNSKFFSSIFGSNAIDVQPQGSIGIDLGVQYQKTDNPSFSPRNRRNFSFDFDQRINLSLLGSIGERLQITANYDTESTFDFQNLVKLQFNPPKLNELSDYLPTSIKENVESLKAKGERIQNRFNEAKSLVNEARSTVEEVKGKLESLKDQANNLQGTVGNYKNKINDFLDKPASEDAILQNIDIGNINMPLNSTLIASFDFMRRIIPIVFRHMYFFASR